LLAAFLSVLVFSYLYCRLFFGVDLTDEAFYNALPVAFARGRKPYVDELIVVQSASLLLTPLTQLFLLFKQNTEGIVLFGRHCFLALSLIAGYVSFKFQRAYIPLLPSVLGTFLLVSFWPFSIPSLSYNTMGMLFLTIGGLIIIGQHYKSHFSYMLPVAVALLLLGAFSYPTFIIPALILFSLPLFKIRKAKIEKGVLLSTILVGLLFGSLLAYLIFFYTSPERLSVIFKFIRTYGIHGTWLSKIALIASQLMHDWKLIAVQLGLLLAPVFLFNYSKKGGIALGFVFAALLLKFPAENINTPPYHLMILSLSLAGLVLSLVRKEFLILMIVSLIAGGLGSWTSGNGISNFAIGALIGVVGYSILLHKSLKEEKTNYAKILFTLVVSSVSVFQLRSLNRSIYGDDSNIKNLTQSVPQGAFKGIKTTPEKIQFMTELSEDLSKYQESASSIAFFDFFAGGPLFSDLKLNTPMIWTNSLSQFPQDRELLASFYDVEQNRPDVLVWFVELPVASYFNYNLRHDRPDALKERLMPFYEQKLVRKDYAIYVKVKQ
jgi:hypothetical protein